MLLVRLLVKADAEVRVLMTPAATQFVSPLTFATLSKHEVLTDVVSEKGWNNHVELGLWADAYLVAPATANTLARLANGICDSVLAAVYLSARCPVLLAPAMDVDMWHHPSTQANITRLQTYGNILIPVGEGELASGLEGAGRLAEPEQILTAVAKTLQARQSSSPGALAGKTVLLTAGPTHEPLDPVRFLGNRSSGKMGAALAECLIEAGAQVRVILGPATDFNVRGAAAAGNRLEIVRVQTAEQMHAASLKAWPSCDAAILAAAVADYRPAKPSDEKIKKKGDSLSLELVRNPDIAAALGEQKASHQRLIGFALETADGVRHATDKLRRKKLDAIVLNMHTATETAFGGDDNAVTILHADGTQLEFPRMPKLQVAQEVCAVLAKALAIMD